MRENRPVIELPRIIDIKYNAIDNVLETLQRLNLEGTCLIVADKITKEIAGQKVHNLISDKFNVSLELISDATISQSEYIQSKIDENNTNFAIAVGGGTVIDIVKYSSYIKKIPFISIPTVASHDGIASARASLIGTSSKHSFEAHSPIAVIGDVETISQAPKRFRLSGSADLISNKTAVLDWQLSSRVTGEHISQYSVALSEITANTIIDQSDIVSKDNIEGTYIVLKGLITSSMAMCIAGSSRPASGSEHMISHMLDESTETTALHGEQCGLAAVFSMYLHGGNWQEIKKGLEILGTPLSFSEFGIDRDQLVEAIMKAQKIRENRFTILSGGISKVAVEKALDITGIY